MAIRVEIAPRVYDVEEIDSGYPFGADEGTISEDITRDIYDAIERELQKKELPYALERDEMSSLGIRAKFVNLAGEEIGADKPADLRAFLDNLEITLRY